MIMKYCIPFGSSYDPYLNYIEGVPHNIHIPTMVAVAICGYATNAVGTSIDYFAVDEVVNIMMEYVYDGVNEETSDNVDNIIAFMYDLTMFLHTYMWNMGIRGNAITCSIHKHSSAVLIETT